MGTRMNTIGQNDNSVVINMRRERKKERKKKERKEGRKKGTKKERKKGRKKERKKERKTLVDFNLYRACMWTYSYCSQ
jgi:hypothetical protein